ncbi:MAG: hypothetical protein ACT4PT_08530 [Methanobacteriota archaeon]
MPFSHHLEDAEVDAFLSGVDAATARAYRDLRATMLRFADLQEEVQEGPAPRVAYVSKCNRFALLTLSEGAIEAEILLGRDERANAVAAGLAKEHPNPIYRKFGWVATGMRADEDPARLKDLLRKAYKRAFTTKAPTDAPNAKTRAPDLS